MVIEIQWHGLISVKFENVRELEEIVKPFSCDGTKRDKKRMQARAAHTEIIPTMSCRHFNYICKTNYMNEGEKLFKCKKNSKNRQ